MVTIYTTEQCAKCHTAKYFFKQKDIEFREESILNKGDEIQKAGFKLLAPVFEIDGKFTQDLSTVMKLV